jgi:hypothetical protein
LEINRRSVVVSGKDRTGLALRIAESFDSAAEQSGVQTAAKSSTWAAESGLKMQMSSTKTVKVEVTKIKDHNSLKNCTKDSECSAYKPIAATFVSKASLWTIIRMDLKLLKRLPIIKIRKYLTCSDAIEKIRDAR